MPAVALLVALVFAAFGPKPEATATPAPVPTPQVAPTLAPHGGAFITTLPAGASAWLDGSYVGQTPVYVDDLLSGQHAVTISRTGWQPETASFEVNVGRVTPVSLVLQRAVQTGPLAAALKGQGMLAVRGAPAGAHVYIDGLDAGVLPVEPRSVEGGFHIVTLETSGKPVEKFTRIVDVYPDTTTTIEFAAASNESIPVAEGEDVLEPLESYVPPSNVLVADNVVTIHYRGMEVECEVGSRTYTINGKAETMSVPPAMLGGKIYLPLSVLQRLVGK
jgi:hypothetical protein